MNENEYTSPTFSRQRLQSLLPLLSLLLLLTTACCKKEEPVNNGRKQKLSFDCSSGSQTDAIREIEVFVFDDQERLLGRTSTQVEGTIVLDYPQTSVLHCIAWGNSKDSGLEFSPLKLGDSLEEGYLILKTLSPVRAGETFSNMPPDLFWGAIQIDNTSMPDDRQPLQMVMLPTTASIHITIDGLPDATGTESGDYSVVVGEPAGRIDFSGSYGGKTRHRLTGTFDTGNDYIIPVFRLFPAVGGEGIGIEVFHGGELLKSITQTSSGKPIIPVPGKELTLLIKFDTPPSFDGNLEIKPPEWDTTDVTVSVTK